MEKEKLVIIGNGMVGVRCLEEILKNDSDRFEITIFGNEPHPNYNRILLSNILVEKNTKDEIITHPFSWYKENGLTLFTNELVKKLDTEKRIIVTDKEMVVEYDKLIIATGSKPFILPIPGVDKEGVVSFRTIEDCELMIESSKKYKKAVVIGAGLLGLEAAKGLIHLGMEVEVVHISENIMNQQLDETASNMLKETLEKNGMKFLLQKETIEILGDTRVSGIRFSDGTETSADLVVMAIGIRPNIQLAKNTSIETDRGILVNEWMETNVNGVYAVGECAEFNGVTYGLVAPLFEQAGILAKHLTGKRTSPYKGTVLSAKLKVSDVDVFSVGDFKESDGAKAFKIHNEFLNVYKKIVIKENKIVGAVLFGETIDSHKVLDYIQKETDISEIMNASIFKTGESKESVLANYAPEDVICGCNGVSKQMITDAIVAGSCTLDEVKACTKAGKSCGGCIGVVNAILEETLGDEFKESSNKTPICSCTNLSKEELVEAIKEKGLMLSKEIRMVLDWKNEDGCSKCRPALNYYLGMLYPIDHVDEKESRFVNERLHANIQKDGTYGVMPRMYGGVTNPNDLKKIAEVAEKYNVPLIKVTGAQRLNLLGVKKDDLPKIWEELDMPSGYAYGKSLRMVKTCVGKDFCRFGTVDSIGLGIKLEKALEGIQTPHKLKMSVSACPRNCAEAGIKDIGIVGLDGVWEIYVGGNAGVDLRAGDLLYRVKAEEEMIDIIFAFLQFYREDARYLERTSHWIERVGLDKIKNVLDDVDKRKELKERLEIALSTHEDPWKKIVEDEKTRKELFETVVITSGGENVGN